MCGQDGNIGVASQLFPNERIPFSSPVFVLCHRKSVFKHFYFIYSFTTAAREWVLPSAAVPSLILGLHFFFCRLIYATGTNVSVTFLK